MYVVRHSFTVQRDQAPSVIDILQGVNESLMGVEGVANGKVFVDRTGPMDTIIWQIESQSLASFCQGESGLFVNLDPSIQHLMDQLNHRAVDSKREIFEVIS